ncbi:MAG: DUF3551 domain-containing protein [Pseudomonadota bacterium]|jgi:hypothetical protein
MRKLQLIAGLTALTAVLAATELYAANANAPVCARIYASSVVVEQCDFYNYQQCQATVQGLGGTCYDNLTIRQTVPVRTGPRSR